MSDQHPTELELIEFFYDEFQADESQKCKSESGSAIETHLKNCPDCTTRLDNWKSSATTLEKSFLDSCANGPQNSISQLQPVEKPDAQSRLNQSDLLNRSVLRNEKPTVRSKRWRIATVALLAVVCFGLGLNFAMYFNSNSNTKQNNNQELFSNLRSELADIKTKLENPVNEDRLKMVERQLQLIHAQVSASGTVSQSDMETLLGQLLSIDNQTQKMRREIRSLAINAQTEITKNRNAVERLYTTFFNGNSDVDYTVYDQP